MSAPTVFSPAKLNLSLAVTGRRADGFHELVSLVVPVDWGDELAVTAKPEGWTLTCDDPAVPVDGGNLVLKAAAAFASATGWRGRAHFALTKRIPMGAGLGGGSSNGAMALVALNRLAGGPLAADALAAVAVQVGSDCALFLAGGPVIMRGRGERIEPLTAADRARLTGRRVLIFKPAFGIATPWAYARLAATAGGYLPAAEAEARLAAWRRNPAARPEDLLHNSLTAPVGGKFPALPALLDLLRRRFGLACEMSGSGSACFALLPDGAPLAEITSAIRGAWGPAAWLREARLL
ncbi:MAG: 4-(cytidine 5'-diphospho)-2-C-methyl-D-erythritol kinase [Opitutaceae bacterium]|nr:4-(cytidine 5'-diphospho)-2-C-methyl-D-erythritol kinase [Opitutaceae bacterium]